MIGLSALFVGGAQAACTVAPAFSITGAPVQELHIPSYEGAILHYRAGENIDGDGSPIAYAADVDNASALESICVGANAYTDPNTKITGIVGKPERLHLKRDEHWSEAQIHALGVRRCQALKVAYNEAKSSGFAQDRYPRMEFYAIQTKQNQSSAPCDPINGFYISTTSLSADPSAPLCSPEHWTDPTRYAFAVLPKKTEFTDRKARYKIVSGVLVLAKNSETYSNAFVGDLGPGYGLGEISYKLAWNLKGLTIDAARMKPEQLRQATRQVALAEPSDFYVLVNSSLEYPAGRLAHAPTHHAFTPQSADIAFSHIDVEAIKIDLATCGLPK